MKGFRRARKMLNVSVAESVRIVRELQGYSENELARRTRIPQATLSAIENNRVRLGVDRAKILAEPCVATQLSWSFPGGRLGKSLRPRTG